MARRARKTPLEKCQEELLTVKASIEQYEHLSGNSSGKGKAAGKPDFDGKIPGDQ